MRSTTTPGRRATSTAPRVVGIVSASGTIDTSTASSTYSGSRVTGAASADGQNIYRWTAGRALLPAELWRGCTDYFFLRVDLAFEPLPRWVSSRRPAEAIMRLPAAA